MGGKMPSLLGLAGAYSLQQLLRGSASQGQVVQAHPWGTIALAAKNACQASRLEKANGAVLELGPPETASLQPGPSRVLETCVSLAHGDSLAARLILQNRADGTNLSSQI